MRIDAWGLINSKLHQIHPDESEFSLGSEDLLPHRAVSRIRDGDKGISGPGAWHVLAAQYTEAVMQH